MNNPKYELFKGRSGKYHFRLKAANGQIVLQSEGYNSKPAAKNGITSLKKNAGNKKRFEVNKARNGKYYFNVVAPNNQVIGKSQMYASRDTLRNGVSSVQRNAKSPVQEV